MVRITTLIAWAFVAGFIALGYYSLQYKPKAHVSLSKFIDQKETEWAMETLYGSN